MFRNFNILDMDINLNLYKTFYIVAESKSFSEASNKLYKTVPAISNNIKDLEDILRVKLFERKNNGVVLTATGKQLQQYLGKAFGEISKAQKMIMKQNSLETGELMIGCPSHIAVSYLMNFIEQAQIDYPELKIQLVSGLNARDLLRLLREHKIDFIVDSMQIGELGSDIIRDEIKIMQNIFIAKEPLKIRDLKEFERQKCIIPFEQTSTTANLRKCLAEHDVTMNVSMQIDITEVRVEAVKRGRGIGYVLRDIVKKQLENEDFYEVEFPIELPVARLNLIYLEEYAEKADKQFIKQYLKKKIQVS